MYFLRYFLAMPIYNHTGRQALVSASDACPKNCSRGRSSNNQQKPVNRAKKIRSIQDVLLFFTL